MKLKYKKLIVLITTGIMGIGMVTFSFTLQGNASKNASEDTPAVVASAKVSDENEELNTFGLTADSITITPIATAAPTPTAEPVNELELNKYEEINKLVEDFYKANLTCLEEDFAPILVDTSVIDMERLQRKTEYIKSYQNINCYTKKGVNEIDYVVYVCYDIELASIETYAPSIDRLLIKYVDGTPKIYMGEIDDETSAGLKELENSEEVQVLISNVDDSLKEARTKDDNLNEFYKSMEKSVSK